MIIHVDGGSRGNPGPAGAGVVICDESGRRLHEGAYFLQRLTNNEAEYHALIRALERAARLGPAPVKIRSDSELLVRQLTGDYRVKSQRLAPLVQKAQLLLLRIPRWSIEHVPRELNRRADELANLAMDRGADLIVFDADGGAAEARVPAASPPPRADEDRAPQPPAELEPASPPAYVRVAVKSAPSLGACPAEGCGFSSVQIGNTLPAGLCVYAAHALLPTLLAIRGTEPAEADAIPTMTVRCSRNGCDAVFHVSPAGSSNGT
ncbi:MAG: reverse transcriptase-like protein [Phycisphaerae bacterium]